MDVRRICMAVVLVGAAGVTHDLFAAGQAGWSGSPSTQQPPSTFDRYNQPTTVPSITQRTQTAITDTGSSMRDGLDAGIRAGENSLGVGSSQPQSSYLNSGGSASPWPSTPSTGSNLAPVTAAPATATPGGGWSSIGTGIAAPKLLVPQSPMTNTGTYTAPSTFGTTSNFGNAGTGSATNGRGPNFPAVAANDQPQMHSVLSDPARSAPTAASTQSGSNWIDNWNNQSATQSTASPNTASQPVTIGRNGSSMRDPEVVPFGSGSTTAQSERGAGNNRQGESWSNGSANSSDPWNRNGSAQATTAGFGNPPTINQPTANQPMGQFANQQPNGQGFNGMQQNGQNTNGFTQAGFGTNNGMMGNGQSQNGMNPLQRMEAGLNGPMTTQPAFLWVLLVLVLAASLAGNFYLGASYLDARQKYQSLVRKTAETFRRVKAAAT